MSVYVDNMQAQLGRMVMSHMLADTTEELLTMADTIGLNRRHIQHAGTPKEHFDVSRSKRAQAVAAGAIEITGREVAALLARKRQEPPQPAVPERYITPIHIIPEDTTP